MLAIRLGGYFKSPRSCKVLVLRSQNSHCFIFGGLNSAFYGRFAEFPAMPLGSSISRQANADASCYPEYAGRYFDCPTRSAAVFWIDIVEILLIASWAAKQCKYF